MRPENALAGTGSRDSSASPAAVRVGAVPPAFPAAGRLRALPRVLRVVLEDGVCRGGSASPEPVAAGLPAAGADARGEAGAAPEGAAGVAAALREPPKSARMTSPPSCRSVAAEPVAARELWDGG